ncbi:MAG: 2-oxoglutarate dehydrogenase, E2 component, dihydrolipoamide succinyltransferase, partial [Acidimicrobiia bacterium]
MAGILGAEGAKVGPQYTAQGLIVNDDGPILGPPPVEQPAAEPTPIPAPEPSPGPAPAAKPKAKP